jgi:hypothetical protein
VYFGYSLGMRILIATSFLLLAASCVAPVLHNVPAVGLAPPVASPAADFSLNQKIKYWQKHIPAMTTADRSEAYLLIGELQIEANFANEARISFYQALAGNLSSTEAGRAEKGIGLSYFLSSQPSLGLSHLEKSLSNLDAVSKAEANYLMAAYKGKPVANASAAVAERMNVFLVSANLKAPTIRGGMFTGPINVDISRSEWRAATMKSNWDKMTTPFRITVHHTAEPFSSLSKAAACAEVKHIQNQHMNERSPSGWADIGYHFLIDRAGNVIAGRPLNAQGAHASGSNNIGNIGICLLGNFVAQPNRGRSYAVAQAPAAAQLTSLTSLVDRLCVNYTINSTNVYGHKELKSTDCPGPAISRWVANYRRTRP